MAFFKFQRDDSAARDGVRGAAAARPDSVEAIRRRARHRLIGAAVLVGLGVVLFPLVFDTQPRSQAVDIPIEIADRDRVPPLASPTAGARAGSEVAAVASSGVTASSRPNRNSAQKPASDAVLEEKSQGAQEIRASDAPKNIANAPAPASVPTPVSQPAATAPAVPAVTAGAAGATGRYVVQFGAFSDAGKAREVRMKVEKAGLKTYTNVAETDSGKRIRVRAGPFAQRGEADRAAERIKALGLPASVLTL